MTNTTVKQEIRFILLDDLSDDFEHFILKIENSIKDINSNYEPINLMPNHVNISDFLKKYRDKKHGSQDNFPNDLKETIGRLLNDYGLNIIFFIDVVWFNNNTAGLDFCTNYLWKIYKEIENQTVFLTVLPLDAKFEGHTHIDKNQLRIDNTEEKTRFNTAIIQAIKNFSIKKQKTRERVTKKNTSIIKSETPPKRNGN